MAEVGLHEDFNGTLPKRPLDVPLVGDPQLLVPREHVLAPTGVEMQIDADALLKFVGGQERAGFLATERTLQPQRIDVGRAKAGEPHPPHQMHVAQAAGRPLDVGLELLDGRAVLGPLLFPRGEAIVDEGGDAPAHDLLLEIGGQSLVQTGRAPNQPRFDQCGRHVDFLAGDGQRIADAADRVPQLEAGVPIVANGLRDDLAHERAGRAVDEEQQIDVGIGTQLTATRPADGNHRHVLGDEVAPAVFGGS